MTRNPSDAEDLVQETYLRGVPRLRRLPRGHEPQGVALQDPHEHVHQPVPGQEAPARPGRPRRRRGLLHLPAARRARGGRRGRAPPRPRCSTRIPDAEVKEALESIPEQFRMAVILADIEGFSYKEIAEILDVPIGTVMSRIHRGRRQLQKRLWDYAERAQPAAARRDGDRGVTSAMDCDQAHPPGLRVPRR